MIRRFVSLAKWGTLQCFIATRRSLMYGRKSKGRKVDPCGTPLEVLDAKPLIDRNSLRFAKYNSNHLFANHVFHDDIIYSTECYDQKHQKPSEGQQKYHMQSYHLQELSLLPQSDLIEHMKLKPSAEGQTEGNI